LSIRPLIGISPTHRFDQKVVVVGGKRVEFLQIESFENVEHFDQDHTTGRRRWHRDDFITAIVSPERRPLFRRVAAQVIAGNQAAMALHVIREEARRLAFIELARTFLLEAPERCGELRLPQDLSLAIELPVAQKNAAAIRAG
jgi:hypothetical protein